MGVEGWHGFYEAIALTKDDPDLVKDVLRLQGELSAQLAERFLRRVKVDAALFSEPIGGDHGPLISPKMYADLVMPSYRPILEVLDKHDVPVRIVRTYANPRPLVDLFIEAGFNCLWAVEAPPKAMDYPSIREQYGADLRLIGGIDTDALRQDRNAIQQAVDHVAPLVKEGGFIPLLDGRVRDDVDFSAYLYYRELLNEITG
jgi:uroporphyrinogen decarboxylase